METFFFLKKSHRFGFSKQDSQWNYCVCVIRFSRVRLCNPVDYSSPGSSVHGILQARILEWVAIFFSRDLLKESFKVKLGEDESNVL